MKNPTREGAREGTRVGMTTANKTSGARLTRARWCPHFSSQRLPRVNHLYIGESFVVVAREKSQNNTQRIETFVSVFPPPRSRRHGTFVAKILFFYLPPGRGIKEGCETREVADRVVILPESVRRRTRGERPPPPPPLSRVKYHGAVRQWPRVGKVRGRP